MIIQDIYIPKYDWSVRVYYAVTGYWVQSIVRDLVSIGCLGENLRKAYRNLSSGNLDTGLTYSSFQDRKTVMVISLTSSPAEFQNSFDHEKGHLCKHIALACDIDPYGEEYEYISGDVGQRLFPVAKKFLCEHCRKELLK